MKPISNVPTGVNFNNEIANNKITYTWNNVNVYLSAKNDKIWDLMMPRKPVVQKHILEDGINENYGFSRYILNLEYSRRKKLHSYSL